MIKWRKRRNHDHWILKTESGMGFEICKVIENDHCSFKVFFCPLGPTFIKLPGFATLEDAQTWVMDFSRDIANLYDVVRR